MDLIVAVYDDWGIGRDGTQPVALRVDRKFFREITQGATVIAGRKTVEDFPGKRPLPNRKNIVLTRQCVDMPGFIPCHSPQEVLELTDGTEKIMVIGGGSVYCQMLPMCDRAYITKVHCTPLSDIFFPNLDVSDQWYLQQVLHQGQEDGIDYEICVYLRKQQ